MEGKTLRKGRFEDESGKRQITRMSNTDYILSYYHYQTFSRQFYRVSNSSAGMISSRFPGDILTKIQQNSQFYGHLPGRFTNPLDHTDPVYPSNSSVKGHLPGIDSPISINPGLLLDVLLVHCEVQKF